jgi:hypothetical protein
MDTNFGGLRKKYDPDFRVVVSVVTHIRQIITKLNWTEKGN